MCGKFGFTSCCGSSEDSGDETSSSKSKSRRKKRSTANNEENGDDKSASPEQPRDPSTINVNMVAPHTIKLLTDIREIKDYKQSELDNDELEKALEIHCDILARLENPTKYV